MNYKNFSSDDFIKDELFQQWVFNPDTTNELFWQNVLIQFPDKHEELLEAKQFLLVFNGKDDEFFESRISNLKKRVYFALDNIHISVNTTSSHTLNPTRKSFLHRRYKIYWAAASVSIVAILSALFFLDIERSTEKLFPAFIQQEQQVTPKGHRSTITLEDGTKVWLNADSRLEYPRSFAGSQTREVHLHGEAFFDVTENKAQPFIVYAGDLRIKVLGTSFNVRSYQVEKNIETTLVKGKVIIETNRGDDNNITLIPNQQAVFEKNTKKIVLENRVNTENYTSWKEGKLQFDDQSLSFIIQELERWYNVTIHVADNSSLGCRFSANVSNKTLEEVLELFKASEAIDYKIEGQEVFIQGKLCED